MAAGPFEISNFTKHENPFLVKKNTILVTVDLNIGYCGVEIWQVRLSTDSLR